jgi:phosphatidylserine decarboxylase
MKLPTLVERALHQERVNFVITNRVPRRILTRFMGWLSRIERPIVRDLSIALFGLFAGDLRLYEAKESQFASLHDCFVRELKSGARPLNGDRSVLVSPCDGIVGALGTIEGPELLQAKGFGYSLEELLDDPAAPERFRGGMYVTLRLTANMYHRFHAPADCEVDGATYVSGDVWNVNPVTLNRVTRLYCRNERAIIHARLDGSDETIALVAVGAILVGSIQLSFLDRPLALSYSGPDRIYCRRRFLKGDEIGYFHHGSTVIVIGTSGLQLREDLHTGDVIRMGEVLLEFGHAVRPTRSSRSAPNIDR